MQVTCDNCGDPFEMDSSEVAEAEVNREEIYCSYCIEEMGLEDEDEDEVEELEADDEA